MRNSVEFGLFFCSCCWCFVSDDVSANADVGDISTICSCCVVLTVYSNVSENANEFFSWSNEEEREREKMLNIWQMLSMNEFGKHGTPQSCSHCDVIISTIIIDWLQWQINDTTICFDCVNKTHEFNTFLIAWIANDCHRDQAIYFEQIFLYVMSLNSEINFAH